jgi:uncharacterized protein
MERTQEARIVEDLARKLVFLVGPRQVGKSWLARRIAGRFQRSLYLNYDSAEDRRIIQREAWRPDLELLVLDELHKMPGWKNHLKGIWDTRPEGLRVLVTGSARLDAFRAEGDSLVGRYFLHHLLPVSPAEARQAGLDLDLDHFLERGGFPEPLLAATGDEANRWRHQYLDGMIRTDILDFENIRSLRAMNQLVGLLRERVASPLSYQALAEDLSVAVNTVRHHIDILEALHIVFRIAPHAPRIARSLRKEPKLYFFDTGLVRGGGARLENLVAVALLKGLRARTDLDGRDRSLAYLKTKEGKEVDFCLVEEARPILLVEVKASDPDLSPDLAYFSRKYEIPGVQAVGALRRERQEGAIAVRDALAWLGEQAI